jgi:hypothetical protein
MIVTALTQRAHFFVLVFLLSIFSISAYTQELEKDVSNPVVISVDGQDIELESDELDMMADEVEIQAEVSKDSKVKEILHKIADQFRKTSEYVSKKVSPNEEKRNARKAKRLARKNARITKRNSKREKRQKSISDGSASKFTKVLYSIGKGSSDVANAISKPFINSAGFLTGFFQKEAKNKEATNFMKFIIQNEEVFDDVYKNTGTIANFAVKFKAKIEDVISKKTVIVLSDTIFELTGERLEDKVILKTIGVDPYAQNSEIPTIGQKVQNKIFKVDPSKLKASLINEHPEFQSIRSIVGDVQVDELAEMLLNPSFEADLDYNVVLGGSKIKLHEGIIAYAGRFFLPKMALNLISSSVSSVVLGISAAASTFDIIGIAACTLHKGNIRKLNDDSDQDLKDFCSYMVNKAVYELSKSRAKGYVAGKNSKSKFNKFIKKTFKSKNTRNEEKALQEVKLM